METSPLMDAAEITPGLWGDHLTSKFHCWAVISPCGSKVPEPMFQVMILLSLPQETRRFGSIMFQSTLRMPFECPAVSLKGYCACLRSHICIEGCWSSSYATISCVGTSGCQATSAHRCRPPGSWKVSTSAFFLRSHTTVAPVLEDEHRMCGTPLFQAQQRTSEPACLLLAEGLYSSGCWMLLMSRMLTSESAPAVAIRFGLNGLNSTQFTVPLWIFPEYTRPGSAPLDLRIA
mmetsp:Transcript_63892/g.166134  ORF Transcript_63892/g.166134 Transcript_63892/m.166134 type:complete len:233 (-) Transcript_63892:360-1058(-)